MIDFRSRLSANLGFLWTDLPLSDRLVAASNAGFLHVELHSPYNEITPQDLARCCDENGLGISCINTPISNENGSYFGLAAVPYGEAKFIADFQKSINYCQITGCRAIHIMAGIVDENEREIGEKTIRDNLLAASDIASLYDISILLEPLSQKAVPRYFYSTNAYILGLIDDLNLGNIGLMLDLFNTHMASENACNIITHHTSKISHVQISSIPDRNEPNLDRGLIPNVIRTLDNVGYSGLIGCEYNPLSHVENGLSWVDELCEALVQAS